MTGFVTPAMTRGGHIAVTTALSGGNFTAFAAKQCRQLTLVNSTGTDLEVRQGTETVYLPVLVGNAFTFFGLNDASDLAVRRVDTSNTQVTAVARWED